MRIPNYLFATLIYSVCSSQGVFANDAEFYMDGNHLVPVYQTNITVRKEILTIKKHDFGAKVTVYYEFFNPNEEKEILVGFESEPARYGESFDADSLGENPCMSKFVVQVNGKNLKYNVAYVLNEDYTKIGIIKKSRSLNEMRSSNNPGFTYVYYFKVKFKKGLNIIRHSYNYCTGSSIAENPIYNYIAYVLTTAMRWGNKQIDDFTLTLDLGSYTNFYIEKTFFSKASEWALEGSGEIKNIKARRSTILKNDALDCRIKKGVMVFRQTNFRPRGEIYIYLYTFEEDISVNEIKAPYLFNLNESCQVFGNFKHVYYYVRKEELELI